MENCIFCKIINREIPSTVVYEDEWTLAFNDIKPVAPIHVIIIPKTHIASVNDLDEKNAAAVAHVHLAAKKVAEKLGIAEKGYRLINNCGPDAGQTVFHLHYHLIGGLSLGEKII
jgi:histidine triad (HIT) family protein